CANALCNPVLPELVHDETRLLTSAGIMAEMLALDRERVLAFTYAWACLNASWWLKLGGSDIDQWFLKVAEIEDTLHDCAPSALRLLKLIAEPNVGLNPDTMDNAWLHPGENLPDALTQIEQVLPHVNHWHVKQFERSLVDGVWRTFPAHADEGTQPVGAIARRLAERGYAGAAIHECGRGTDAAYRLKRFLDYFHWLLEEYVPGVSEQP